MQKRCSRCKETKDISNFWRNKTRKDSYGHECIECIKKLKHYGKTFKCEICGEDFVIKHRNVLRRKTFKCKTCLAKEAIARLIKYNKDNYTGKIINEKGYELTRDIVNKKYILSHRKVVQNNIGRKLTKKEVVHHIDGDKTNNNISNLYITEAKEHNKIHASLEKIAFILLEKGSIIFNKETGLYELI